jgi:hypothetical protein
MAAWPLSLFLHKVKLMSFFWLITTDGHHHVRGVGLHPRAARGNTAHHFDASRPNLCCIDRDICLYIFALSSVEP